MELPFPCVQQQAQSPFQHLYPGCQSQSFPILLRHQPGWISPCFLRGEMVAYAAWWHEAGVTGRAHHRAPAGVRRGNLDFRLWGERGAWPSLKALSLGWDQPTNFLGNPSALLFSPTTGWFGPFLHVPAIVAACRQQDSDQCGSSQWCQHQKETEATFVIATSGSWPWCCLAFDGLLPELGQHYFHPCTAPALSREGGKHVMVLLNLLPAHSSAGRKHWCRAAGHTGWKGRCAQRERGLIACGIRNTLGLSLPKTEFEDVISRIGKEGTLSVQPHMGSVMSADPLTSKNKAT